MKQRIDAERHRFLNQTKEDFQKTESFDLYVFIRVNQCESVFKHS